MKKKVAKKFAGTKENAYLCNRKRKQHGTLAQVVEQWTENPCVLGSTPRGTTPPFIRAVLARGRLYSF